MEERDFLDKLTKVKAPLEFEQKLMAQLSLRKQAKYRMQKRARFSFAIAGASLIVVFIALSVFILPKKSQVGLADLQENIPSKYQETENKEVIPLIESVDYSQEMHNFSGEPKTVYILEQVSNVSNTRIIY